MTACGARCLAMLKNGPVCSLEFTTTLQAYQRKGFARAICQAAIKEAFRDGAEVVTIRAGVARRQTTAQKASDESWGLTIFSTFFRIYNNFPPCALRRLGVL